MEDTLLYPMFPAAHPTCRIQWIDAHCEPTPDQNPAVGLACFTTREGTRKWPICSHHLKRLMKLPAFWTFEPYEKK